MQANGAKDENGKTTYVEAIEGIHYTIASGSLTSDVLTIVPLGDVVICGNYNGKTTSPKTGDYSVYFALIALLSLAGVAVASKKVFSKYLISSSLSILGIKGGSNFLL